MKKIPFEATFTGAYKFLFYRFFSIIGVVWLPTLLLVGLSAGLLYLTVPHGWWQGHFPVLPEGTKPSPEAVWDTLTPIFLAFFPIIILLFLWSTMTTVGLMRLALGEKKRFFIFFSMGADFWRLIGNTLLAFLVMMLIYILLIGGFILGAIFLGPLIGKGWSVLVFVLALIAAFAFLIYTAIRLTFFLPAVAVAEHEVNLGRSWELAAGNFWRIVGISLLISIPPTIVSQVFQEIVVVSPLFAHLVQLGNTHDIAAIVHAALPLAGTFLAILLVQNIAVDALCAAATAKAYLAVTGDDEVTP